MLNKLKILILSLLLVATNIKAKELKFEQKLQKAQESNFIKNYADKKSLADFRKKVYSHNFNARVFGDSHIGADFFTNKLRSLLLTPNSIGFAYPLQPKYQQNLILKYEYDGFDILNSKNTSDENISYPLGGVIAKALDKKAYIKLDTLLDDKNFKVGILFKSPNSKNAFEIKDSKNKSYKLKTPQANKWSYQELRLVLPLEIKALQKDVQLGGYFIYKDKNNHFIDTLGINGAKSDLWLKWNIKVSLAELKILKNDLIILTYGSNDALYNTFDKEKFKNNYKKFINILKQNNPNALFVIISPPTVTQKKGRNYKVSDNFYPIRKSLYEIAKEEKTLLFDMHNFIQESGGKNAWIKQELSRQDVHLSIKGYELMGEKLYKDLMKTLK